MSNEISEEFKNWACSFSGCDGGNPKADIWLCGIENANPEQDKKENIQYYKSISAKGCVEISEDYDFFSKENKYGMKYRGFNQNFAKIYNAYLGNKAEDFENLLDGDEKILKLNLYPIAFRNTSSEYWNEYNLKDITGFKNKYLYQTWCFFNRAETFRELRKEYKPKLIICVGTSYLLDFIMFFGKGGADSSANLQSETLIPESDKNKYPRTFYHLRITDTDTDEGTLLVVIPFTSGSSSGLNSYFLWNEMGKKIKELMEK